MRSMRALVWRNLVAHPLRSTLTALAITLGVAMVLAAAILGQAASQRVTQLEDQSGVHLEIIGRDGSTFNVALLDLVRFHPDVRRSSPSLNVEVVGVRPAVPHLTLQGIDPKLYPAFNHVELTGGAFLDAPNTIMLPLIVAQTFRVFRNPKGLPGPIDQIEVQLQTGANVDRAKSELGAQLVPELALARATTDAGGPATAFLFQLGLAIVGVIMLFAPAQPTSKITWALAWRNLAQHRLRTSLSALAVALGVAMVVAADVIAEAFRGGLSQAKDVQTILVGLMDELDRLLVLVGVMITAAAGFLVFNAFAMSVTQRRQQIGALRALGMTRGQVLRLVVVEALIVGGLGTLLGLVGGPLIGRGVVVVIRSLGSAFNAFGVSDASPSSMLLAAGIGLGVTLASVLFPAWQATRISPMVALRAQTEGGIQKAAHSEIGRHGVRLGWATIAALAVYLAVAPPGEWVWPPWDVRLAALFTLAWLGGLALVTPGLIGALAHRTQRPFGRWWGATGRLIADNLGRGRRRVTVTVATLAVGLAMVVSMTGFMNFWLDGLFMPTVDNVADAGGWAIYNFDFTEGLAAYTDLDSLQMSPRSVAAVREVVGDQGAVMDVHFVIVPELSFLGSSYFSMVLDPQALRESGDALFTFSEGDWESAMPILERGCGVLTTPLVARNNQAGLGDAITVQGVDGPVQCTIAGLGPPLVYASIISGAAGAAFGVGEPFGLYVYPRPGADRDRLDAALHDLASRSSDVFPHKLTTLMAFQIDNIETIKSLLSGMLVLTILAAALGVINTTMMSVAERRQELGLLRAVGATRRQVRAVVVGEAALMGLLGGGLGTAAGAGFTIILAVVYGGNAVGIEELPLWPSAWKAARPALLNGLLGLAAAPFICAAAAWLPTRRLLRGAAIETLRPEPQDSVSPRQAVVGIFRWGSLRVRFVLGTGALMLLVLAGLISVVVGHERAFLEEQMQDILKAMIQGQAGLIELNLPPDAQTVNLEHLEVDRFGGDLNLFDAENMLRFRALVDDMSAYGLDSFAITDRDNVVLLGLDPRQLGERLTSSAPPDETQVTARKDEAGKRQLRASAPIHNANGAIVGSAHMTVDLAEADAFQRETRDAFWSVGGVIVLLGMAMAWVLATPLTSATAQLSAHAAGVGRGEYVPVPHSRGWLSTAGPAPWAWIVAKTSLRTRLTAAMVLIVILLVVALELTVLPIERSHTESKLKEGMAAALEWMGQIVSEGLATGTPSDLFSPDLSEPLALDQLLDRSGTFDWGKLQELSQLTQSRFMAYTALADKDGLVLLSDQFSQIGTQTVVPAETRIGEHRWRDANIWLGSTPLYQGQDGNRVGALQMGVRRAAVEEFLEESRLLFRMSGLMAVLAGVLFAQAVGSAVTAPVRELTAGTRRIIRGDLDVHFDVGTRDELALLARAYNEMVAGLREREWLRDMFGRFVSREVAEAIRTGQVRLQGENRVVSVLFCDIRGFTARSEKTTPEQMVALLNAYLPIVVNAAQAHGGTVNKFGGDSTLIIYGAPRAVHESAYQALLTALQMRTNLATLNARLVEKGEGPICIGVGINTGVALAGAVGPEERQEYTVIGDTVNLASRIEALNKTFPEHDILISRWTYEALGKRRAEFTFVDLGELDLRGKEEPVQVWAVVGRA